MRAGLPSLLSSVCIEFEAGVAVKPSFCPQLTKYFAHPVEFGVLVAAYHQERELWIFIRYC